MTKVNIGISKKPNLVGVEIDKPFEEITYQDVYTIAKEHYGVKVGITGWEPPTPKHDNLIKDLQSQVEKIQENKGEMDEAYWGSTDGLESGVLITGQDALLFIKLLKKDEPSS